MDKKLVIDEFYKKLAKQVNFKKAGEESNTSQNQGMLSQYLQKMLAAKSRIDSLLLSNQEIPDELVEEFTEPIYDYVYSFFSNIDEYNAAFPDGSGDIFSSTYAEDLLGKIFQGGYEEFSTYVSNLHQ